MEASSRTRLSRVHLNQNGETRFGLVSNRAKTKGRASRSPDGTPAIGVAMSQTGAIIGRGVCACIGALVVVSLAPIACFHCEPLKPLPRNPVALPVYSGQTRESRSDGATVRARPRRGARELVQGRAGRVSHRACPFRLPQKGASPTSCC